MKTAIGKIKVKYAKKAYKMQNRQRYSEKQYMGKSVDEVTSWNRKLVL